MPQLRMTRTGGSRCHGCNERLLIFTSIWGALETGAVSGTGGERWFSVGIGGDRWERVSRTGGTGPGRCRPILLISLFACAYDRASPRALLRAPVACRRHRTNSQVHSTAFRGSLLQLVSTCLTWGLLSRPHDLTHPGHAAGHTTHHWRGRAAATYMAASCVGHSGLGAVNAHSTVGRW